MTAPEIMGPSWQAHVRRMREREAAQRANARSPESLARQQDEDAKIRDAIHGLIIEGRLDEYRRLTQSPPSPLPPSSEESEVTVQIPDEADLAAEVADLADGGRGLGNIAWLAHQRGGDQ